MKYAVAFFDEPTSEIELGFHDATSEFDAIKGFFLNVAALSDFDEQNWASFKNEIKECEDHPSLEELLEMYSIKAKATEVK